MIGILPVSPAESRRPSTHSVGILPISMFGEGGEKPRRPSTHSLGVFPFGCFGEDKPERPRRCSTHSLGPLVVPVSFQLLDLLLPQFFLVSGWCFSFHQSPRNDIPVPTHCDCLYF